MMDGKIMHCGCESKFQDKEYGDHQRLHNWAASHPSKDGGWRCTVCESTKGK